MSPESGPSPAKKAEKSGALVWRIAWRFFKRGRRYLPRIFLTILVIIVASGAKAGQMWILKPILDGFNRSGASVVRKDGNPTKAETVDFTVTFDKPVTGVDASDFSVVATNLQGEMKVTNVTSMDPSAPRRCDRRALARHRQ